MEPTEQTEPTEQVEADTETTEILLDLLKGAALAHGVHEKEQGKADPDWPQWYARHMTRALREGGHRISREH